VVAEEAGKNRHNQRLLQCRCDCGEEPIVALTSLRSGNTTSCGCGRRKYDTPPLHPGLQNLNPWQRRFFSQVEILGIDDCWPWRGALSRWGYGQFNCLKSGRRVNYNAQRMAWGLFFGELPPEELVVKPSCGNSVCCNPFHMVEGTREDWNSYLASRDHPVAPAGERSGKNKLTEAQVEEVLLSGGPHVELARRLRVTPENIAAIRKGKTWRHVRSDIPRPVGQAPAE
jgi:hypothetical protein